MKEQKKMNKKFKKMIRDNILEREKENKQKQHTGTATNEKQTRTENS